MYTTCNIHQDETIVENVVYITLIQRYNETIRLIKFSITKPHEGHNKVWIIKCKKYIYK